MKVLITGACSGIAFLTGISLNERGHTVYMTTHTEKQRITLENKLMSMNIHGINVFKMDIGADDINKIKKLDIDVLINHAAIGIGGSILNLEIDKVRENFDINFFSSFTLAKIFLNKLIKENRKGKVIFTSSMAGYFPLEFLGSYCSTKSAITMMAKCLRKELKYKNSNIQISVIEPGAYRTGFNQVMIDTINSCINKNSYFYDVKNQVGFLLNLKFKLTEKKNLNSIVCQILKAVEDKNNRMFYSAPLFQNIFKKIYLLFE